MEKVVERKSESTTRENHVKGVDKIILYNHAHGFHAITVGQPLQYACHFVFLASCTDFKHLMCLQVTQDRVVAVSLIQ
jgi:hypothetical protein